MPIYLIIISYINDIIILISTLPSQGSNIYVKNDSHPTHKITEKYNPTEDTIEHYVDGILKSNKSTSDSPSPSSFTDGNGYVKFDNGLIMQWGKIPNVRFDEAHYENIMFPIKFPHICFSIVCSVQQQKKVDGVRVAYLITYDQSQFTILPGYHDTILNADICWMAIGY